MRVVLMRSAAVVALSLAAAPIVCAEETVRSVSIACDMFEMRADRGKTRISRPLVQTLEGQPAVVEVGRRHPTIEIETGRKLQLWAGIKCQFTPYCLANGKVELDLEVDVTEPAAANDDGVAIRKSGVRIVRTIDWGEPSVVSIRNTAGEVTHVIELKATELAREPPRELPADEVPPAPPGRRRIDLGVGAVPFRPAPVPGIR